MIGQKCRIQEQKHILTLLPLLALHCYCWSNDSSVILNVLSLILALRPAI